MPIEPSVEWMSKDAGLLDGLRAAGQAVAAEQERKAEAKRNANPFRGEAEQAARAAYGTRGHMSRAVDWARAHPGWDVKSAPDYAMHVDRLKREASERIYDATRVAGKANMYKEFVDSGMDRDKARQEAEWQSKDYADNLLNPRLPVSGGRLWYRQNQGYARFTPRSEWGNDAKLGDYGSTKQAAEGTVPSAEASMPAHEEAHDTHGNEVNPFEKVVKAYNTYKAKKGFKEETPAVTPNVTGNLPPAPANLVHEWYAKEHGMERMASAMEKYSVWYNPATWGVEDTVRDTVNGVAQDAGFKDLADARRHIDSYKKTADEFNNNVSVLKGLRDDMHGMYNSVKEWWDKYGKGNHIGSLFGMGGENWKWGLGALGLAGAGYGAYRMFSGGGGSGGGWGGGAANGSAYYRNRHGYRRPDYEGMMVDNMMARRGGYGY